MYIDIFMTGGITVALLLLPNHPEPETLEVSYAKWKKKWTTALWSSFQLKAHFALHLEIKSFSGAKVESAVFVCVSYADGFWWLIGPLCFIKSKVNAVVYLEIL